MFLALMKCVSKFQDNKYIIDIYSSYGNIQRKKLFIIDFKN